MRDSALQKSLDRADAMDEEGHSKKECVYFIFC